MSYFELVKLAAPETIVLVTALVVLATDLFALRELELRVRLLVCAMISCMGCAVAMGWMVVLPQHGDFAHGMLVVDPLTQWVKGGLLVLTILTAVISVDTDFTPHAGEYFALVLLAALGMMFLAGSEDILMIFVALELTSLSLYILTAFNKRNVKSAEAALKYFLFGGVAAAFTLFGLSWLYGITGATHLSEISRIVGEKALFRVDTGDGARIVLDPLLVGALVMTVVGFGFKVAAVPFHLWAPDAYEGAPAPSAALVASGSKLASFFVLSKVLTIGFAGVEGGAAWHDFGPGWVPLLTVLAAASLVLGNLAAIVQTSVRRLLAYSAIAHGGYMLLAVAARGEAAMTALIYYAMTYGLTTVGAFAVVSVVEQQSGRDDFSAFAGLSQRAPVLSFCMLIFMLSLAGIPPLAGFFGKFYIFAAAVGSDTQQFGLLWLVVLAIAASAVSLYYYLQVLKQIYVADAPSAHAGGGVPAVTQVAVLIMAFGVVVLGCAQVCSSAR